MDNKTRYKELIKENNVAISYLSDSYQRIVLAYTKKARGFGVKSLDTEVRIKKVIEEVTEFDQKNIDVNVAIPNMTDFIEERVKLISKAPSLKFKIKEIVAVTLLIVSIIAYFVVDKACSKDVKLGEPINAVVTVTTSTNCFYLTWQNNEYAKEGYTLLVYKNDELIKETIVPWQVIDATDKYVGTQYFQTDIMYVEGNNYRFEITAKRTSNFAKSETTIINYPNNEK